MANKKNFKENPALRFLSTPEDTAPSRSGGQADGYKTNPMYVETRSRRLQLVLQPSLYEKIRDRAANEEVSINEYIHRILSAAVED